MLPQPLRAQSPPAEDDDAVYRIKEVTAWSELAPTMVTVVFDGYEGCEVIPLENVWQSDGWADIAEAWRAKGGELPQPPVWMVQRAPIGARVSSAAVVLNWLQNYIIPFQSKLARCYIDCPQGTVVGTTIAEAFFTLKATFGERMGQIGTQRPLEALQALMKQLAITREIERTGEYQRRFGKAITTTLPNDCCTVFTKKAIGLAERVYSASAEDCFEVVCVTGTTVDGSLSLRATKSERPEPGAPWTSRAKEECRVIVRDGSIHCSTHGSFYRLGIVSNCVAWCCDRQNFRSGWVAPRWWRIMVCVTEDQVKLDNMLWKTMFQADYDAPKGILMTVSESESVSRRFASAPQLATPSPVVGDNAMIGPMAETDTGEMDFVDVMEPPMQEEADDQHGLFALCSSVDRKAQFGRAQDLSAQMMSLLSSDVDREVANYHLNKMAVVLEGWQSARSTLSPGAAAVPAGSIPITPQCAAAPNTTRNSTESNHPHYLEPGGCRRHHGFQKHLPRPKGGSQRATQRSRRGPGNEMLLRAASSTTKARVVQVSACQTTTPELTLVASRPAAISAGGSAELGAFLESDAAGDGTKSTMAVHCCVMGVHSEAPIYFRVRETTASASAIAEQARAWVWVTMPRGQAMAVYARELADTHGPLVPKCDLRKAAMSKTGYTCAVCVGLPPTTVPSGWRRAPNPDAPGLERKAKAPDATAPALGSQSEVSDDISDCDDGGLRDGVKLASALRMLEFEDSVDNLESDIESVMHPILPLGSVVDLNTASQQQLVARAKAARTASRRAAKGQCTE
jgi:hypothetical protein